MEAAGYGLPAVTIFTLPDEARIFGIDHVGLVGTCLVARTADEYEAMLERLIVDDTFRIEKGEAARQAIERLHVPPGWRSSLEAAFERVRSLPARANNAVATNVIAERPYLGSPDDIHQDIVGAEPLLSEIKMIYMGALPLRQRIAQWSRMRRQEKLSARQRRSTPAARMAKAHHQAVTDAELPGPPATKGGSLPVCSQASKVGHHSPSPLPQDRATGPQCGYGVLDRHSPS